MADLQHHFLEFHEVIKLRRYDENRTLRAKRDIIRRKLDERLPDVFNKHGEECPNYFYLDQGSYAADTGVVPLDGDFDIDQGLYFDVHPGDWDPVTLKKRVRDALAGHTRGANGKEGVRIRRPCVTVQYHSKGRPLYHVDIAVYANRTDSADTLPHIAMGKERSSLENRSWEVSDPQGLQELIRTAAEGDNGRQFRRVVRYLKRWKDHNFPSNGNAAPLGISITVAAHEDFKPVYGGRGTDSPNDLAALQGVVAGLLDRFNNRSLAWFLGDRWSVSIRLPVAPYADLCSEMTPGQVDGFRKKMERLSEVLDYASRARSEQRACGELRGVFGDSFPSGI